MKNLLLFFLVGISYISYSQNETTQSIYTGKLFYENILTTEPKSRNELIEKLENITAKPLLVLTYNITSNEKYAVIKVTIDTEKSQIQYIENETIIINKSKHLVFDVNKKQYFKIPEIRSVSKNGYVKITDTKEKTGYFLFNEDLPNITSPFFTGEDYQHGIDFFVRNKGYSILQETKVTNKNLDFKEIFDHVDPKSVKKEFSFL